MTTPAVEVTDLAVSFGGVTAVEDVSLSIPEGEFFTLVGPSGCGKTTLLRAIAGLEPPSEGTVTIAGQDVTGEPPEARNVGIVFQDYALFPHLSVAENVGYGLRFHELSDGRDPDARVSGLLDLVGLDGLGDRDPDQLSGGQQQRVALARALAPEPDVLLLDEPLSALDARLRKELRVQIKTIQQELGTTTVYVTHDQAEALAISDRLAVVQDGRLLQVDTPEQVYRQPVSRAVAEFVGDNNVFSGIVADGGAWLSVGDAQLPLPDKTDVSDGTSLTVSVRPEAICITDRTPSDATIDNGSPPDGGPPEGVGPGGPGAGGVGPDVGDREAPSLSATVETVEFLGDAYRVHCRWNGRTVMVKTTAVTPPEGEVGLRFDADDVQIL